MSIKTMEAPLLNRDIFFLEFPSAVDNFEKANIAWEILESIYLDYLNVQEDLKTAANYSLNLLLGLNKVHSVSSRVKDAKHLIEKIIRKRSDSNDFEVSVDDYKTKIHDLIGLRAMHLFKTDWEQIHDGILSKWKIHQKPVANFRDGDPDQIKNAFEAKGCELKKHKFGYRSTHYIVEVPVGKQIFFAEIQVRTIYEEAWSEIDHTIRYPYFVNSLIINEFSSISNRLSGMADEMGTFIKLLSEDITQNNKQIDEYKLLIEKLENTIEQTNIDQESKNKINKELGDVLTYIPQKVEASDQLVGSPYLMSNRDILTKSQAVDFLGGISNFTTSTDVLTSLDHMRKMHESIGTNSTLNSLDRITKMHESMGTNTIQSSLDRVTKMHGLLGANPVKTRSSRTSTKSKDNEGYNDQREIVKDAKTSNDSVSELTSNKKKTTKKKDNT